MQIIGLLIYAIIAGALLPLQSGLNAQIGKTLGHPMWGAMANFAVGMIALVLYIVLAGVKLPSQMQLATVPGWMWTGGLMGAFFVVATVVLAPRLGAATMISLLVAGQMLMSVWLDHYGLVGFPEHPLNLWRALGIVLLVGGVVLVRMF